MRRRGRRRLIGAIALAAALVGCNRAASDTDTPPMAVASAVEKAPVRRFAFTTLDGRRVSGRGYRGRMTVIALVATYDTASQAQARFLHEVYRRHTPRINALLLVLEPEKHRPLVEAFADSLDLGYDVAMADEATIAGEGPFPGLHHVPSLVLLDREGREVWRNLGLVEADALSDTISAHDPR